MKKSNNIIIHVYFLQANSPMLLKDESRHSEQIPAMKDSSETEESIDIKQISSFPDEFTPPVHEVVSH